MLVNVVRHADDGRRIQTPAELSHDGTFLRKAAGYRLAKPCLELPDDLAARSTLAWLQKGVPVSLASKPLLVDP